MAAKTQVEAMTTKMAKLVVMVRVLFADGDVHYVTVRGTAYGQSAVVVAWQQAEMDRPEVAVVSADVASITEEDPDGEPLG